MEIYEFNKCLLTRQEECLNVLSWQNDSVPASGVRAEWAYMIELQIEPTGWQALWKIPRVSCEELKIKYPTVVFGIVEQVLFKELKAIFLIQAVQDDEIHLPERQKVNLQHLFVTKAQKNTELNIDKTADCIDALRFFYNYIWMPWDNDNDDDIDWAEKRLESRILFYYDLKKREMKRSLAAHISNLLNEAYYIQERRECIEMSLSDDEDDIDNMNDKSKNNHKISQLMNLNLRLTIIKSEVELLENPEMRKIFEVKFNDNENFNYTKDYDISSNGEKCKKKEATVYIVTKPFTLLKQIQYLEITKEYVDKEKLTQMCLSLQDALNICNPSDDIFLFPGIHSIRYLEYLNENGSINGLFPFNDINSDNATRIMSSADDCVLLIINGNFTLRNLTLDCRNIRTGILIKSGNVILENCQIYGDGNSSTDQGIVITGQSSVILENCSIQKFSIGVLMYDQSEITIRRSSIESCAIGIQIRDENIIKFDKSNINNSKKFGIYMETKLFNVEEKSIIVENLHDVKGKLSCQLPWNGECSFKNNEKGNIFVVNLNEINFPNIKDCNLPNSLENLVEAIAKGTMNENDQSFESSYSNDSDVIVVDDSLSEQ